MLPVSGILVLHQSFRTVLTISWQEHFVFHVPVSDALCWTYTTEGYGFQNSQFHHLDINANYYIKRERARERAGIESTAAAPSQPDCPGVSRPDYSAGSKESALWRALEQRSDWHGRLGVERREKDPRSRSFSLSSTSILFSSLSSTSIFISSRCLFSCHSLLCPAPVRPGCLFSLVSFPSFSLLPTPNRPYQSERSSEARHKADSFELAEWSGRLTPGQLGWLGAAAVGSIPALALSHSPKNKSKIYFSFSNVFIDQNKN